MIKTTRWTAALCALLLAGCGGGGGASTSTSSSTGTSTATSTTPVTPVVPGTTIVPLATNNQAYPEGMVVTPDGSTLYFVNTASNQIMRVDLTNSSYHTTALTLTWSGSATALDQPVGLAISPGGNALYLANKGGTTSPSGFLAQVDLSSCGNGTTPPCTASTIDLSGGASNIDNPYGIAVYKDQGSGTVSLLVANHGGTNVIQVPLSAPYSASAVYPSAGGISPWGIWVASNSRVYFTDNLRGSVGSLSLASGTMDATTYADLDTGFTEPTGMVEIGNDLYVADYQAKTIRKIDLTGAQATTSLDVSPHQPYFLATDGTHLFFSDGNSGSVDEILQP